MKIKVSNMNCMNCVNKITDAFELNDIEATFDLDNKEIQINSDIDLNVVIKIIEHAGYTVVK